MLDDWQIVINHIFFRTFRLVEAFADEQAISDVLYYLSQALENGCIDPDEFLKAVRDQSRNQFMKRAMVFQCRAKAGLPPV